MPLGVQVSGFVEQGIENPRKCKKQCTDPEDDRISTTEPQTVERLSLRG